METLAVPLDHPRRIFARSPRRNILRLIPWVVTILCLAGASAAAGAIIAHTAIDDSGTLRVVAAGH
jgi:hypothetical protein